MTQYRNTSYYSAMQWFLKQVDDSEARGFSVDYLGERIVNIYELSNPGIRYAIVPNKLTGWLLPRLPAQLIDWIMGRLSGLRNPL